MISQMAMEDLDDLIGKGLRPRPADVVRLNALGLRVQFTREGNDLGVLPRVAILGNLRFREPTIGHEIWLKEVDHVFDLDKWETLVTVRAYSLSRDQAVLPDPADAKLCAREVDAFRRKELVQYTPLQLAVALVYAETGNYSGVGERIAERESADEDKPQQPGEHCFDIGVLYHGVMIGLGSAAELRGYPASQLRALVREKIRRDEQFGVYTKEWNNDAMADYLRTKDEIEERLKSEVAGNG